MRGGLAVALAALAILLNSSQLLQAGVGARARWREWRESRVQVARERVESAVLTLRVGEINRASHNEQDRNDSQYSGGVALGFCSESLLNLVSDGQTEFLYYTSQQVGTAHRASLHHILIPHASNPLFPLGFLRFCTCFRSLRVCSLAHSTVALAPHPLSPFFYLAQTTLIIFLLRAWASLVVVYANVESDTTIEYHRLTCTPLVTLYAVTCGLLTLTIAARISNFHRAFQFAKKSHNFLVEQEEPGAQLSSHGISRLLAYLLFAVGSATVSLALVGDGWLRRSWLWSIITLLTVLIITGCVLFYRWTDHLGRCPPPLTLVPLSLSELHSPGAEAPRP